MLPRAGRPFRARSLEGAARPPGGQARATQRRAKLLARARAATRLHPHDPRRRARAPGAGPPHCARRRQASGRSNRRTAARRVGARNGRRPRLPAGQHRGIGRRARVLHAASRRRAAGQGSRARRRPSPSPIPTRHSSIPRRARRHFQTLARSAHRPAGPAVGARLRRLRPRPAASRRVRPGDQPARPPVRLSLRRRRLPLDAERLSGRSGRRDNLHRRGEPDPAASGAHRLRRRAQDQPPAARRRSARWRPRTTSSRRPGRDMVVYGLCDDAHRGRLDRARQARRVALLRRGHRRPPLPRAHARPERRGALARRRSARGSRTSPPRRSATASPWTSTTTSI